MLNDVVLEIERLLKEKIEANINIGLEDSLSADDTPFIRIVPTQTDMSDFSFELYIGTDVKDELRESYEEHLNFVNQIYDVIGYENILDGVCTLQNAIFDKDIVQNFKTSLLSFNIEGVESCR